MWVSQQLLHCLHHCLRDPTQQTATQVLTQYSFFKGTESMCKPRFATKHIPWQSAATRAGSNEVVWSVAGAKRMRPPLQQQAGSNSSAYQHPSSEIAMQQQMLKQQHHGRSGSLFGNLGQVDTDTSQIQMHSQATGLHSSALLSASLDAVCSRLHCVWALFATCQAALPIWCGALLV